MNKNPSKESITVTLSDGREVVVSEMTWRDGVRLVKGFSGIAAELIGVFYADAAKGETKETGSVEAKLVSTICESVELSSLLIEGATNLNPKEIGELSIGDALDLVAAAVPLNINADVLGKARRVGDAVRSSIESLGRNKTTPASVG